MAYRRRMSKRGSRRSFTKGAMRIHPKNSPHFAMRGGIRL